MWSNKSLNLNQHQLQSDESEKKETVVLNEKL